ncbi:hypothetical protein [Streptomyces sp. NBC_00878]|uniref:hypothetical protein n=1 Tax=Streptomyces sp. NBC_00878 TaxID=2975854 RepID=UPI002255BE2D|nr:hypothetical protein [Streptomyces sp. NBC_00878]MCX4903576.1 hypothetical protein [Streptomyces sp. NBC_00878]
MSTRTDHDNALYAYLWQGSPYPHRWVLWDTVGDILVFDRDTNCLVDIDDDTVRDEVVRRMREAGVPESDDYPGRPCA